MDFLADRARELLSLFRRAPVDFGVELQALSHDIELSEISGSSADSSASSSKTSFSMGMPVQGTTVLASTDADANVGIRDRPISMHGQNHQPTNQESFTMDFINGCLPDTKDPRQERSLQQLCSDGTVLCHLISTLSPGTLDPRVINYPVMHKPSATTVQQQQMLPSQAAHENLQLAVLSARAMCQSCGLPEGVGYPLVISSHTQASRLRRDTDAQSRHRPGQTVNGVGWEGMLALQIILNCAIQSAMTHCPPRLEAAINVSAGTHSSALTSLPPPDLLGIWEDLHPLAPSPLSSLQQSITHTSDLCNRTQVDKLQHLVTVWDQELQQTPSASALSAPVQACKSHVESSPILNQVSSKDSAAFLQELKLPMIGSEVDSGASESSHDTHEVDPWEATIIDVKRHCSQIAADTSTPLMLQLCPLQRQYLNSSQPLVQHAIAACLFDFCCHISACSSKWTDSGKALHPQLKLVPLKQHPRSSAFQPRHLAFLKPEPASCKPEPSVPEQQQAITSQTVDIARHLCTASHQTAVTQVSTPDRNLHDTQRSTIPTYAEDSSVGDLAVSLESVQTSMARLRIPSSSRTQLPSSTIQGLLPDLHTQASEVLTTPVASSRQPLSLYEKPSKRSLVRSGTATNAFTLLIRPNGTGWGQLPPPPGNLCCSTALVEPQDERLLRLWLIGLDPSIRLQSLCGTEMRSGKPLLTAIETIHPGSISGPPQSGPQTLPFLFDKRPDDNSAHQATLRQSGFLGRSESQLPEGILTTWQALSSSSQEAGEENLVEAFVNRGTACSSRRSVARNNSAAVHAWAGATRSRTNMALEPAGPALHASSAAGSNASAWASAGDVASGSISGSMHVHQAVSRLHALQRCNSAVLVASKVLQLPLVNIGGQDVANGRSSAILPLVNHLMRYHMGQLIGRREALASGSAGGLTGQAEEVLLEWASRRLATAGYCRLPSSYCHTPAAGTIPDMLPLVRLLSLLQSVRFELPDLALRTDAVTGLCNARYLLSALRKCGVPIFLAPYDLLSAWPRASSMLLVSMLELESKTRLGQSNS